MLPTTRRDSGYIIAKSGVSFLGVYSLSELSHAAPLRARVPTEIQIGSQAARNDLNLFVYQIHNWDARSHADCRPRDVTESPRMGKTSVYKLVYQSYTLETIRDDTGYAGRNLNQCVKCYIPHPKGITVSVRRNG